MKKFALFIALACAASTFAQSQAQPQSQSQLLCRDLKESGGFLYQGETVINGQACRQVAYTPVQQAALAASASPSVDPKPVPVVAAPADSEAPASPAASGNTHRACLIVTSAEGHRFRNSMIAGALTGGIGFAVGAASGGAKYEYRDSYNLPASDVKVKYKGTELQHLEQSGVHIIVVDKKDKTGAEVKDARTACQQQ